MSPRHEVSEPEEEKQSPVEIDGKEDLPDRPPPVEEKPKEGN